MTDCTIIIPCYNEAQRLDRGAFAAFVRQGHPCRFLFVNDGSTDDTLLALESLHRADPAHFGILNLPRNRGKAGAVRLGVLRAWSGRPRLIGYWDADLATPLTAIPEFCGVLEAEPHVEMVLGARVRLLGRSIRRRPLRHYLGRVFATAASLVLGMPVYDTQCGAKVFRATAEMVSLFAEPFRSRWLFDVELLARFVRARQAAGEAPAEEALYELPLAQWQDVAGSKLKARDFLRAVLELAAIRRRYGRPQQPPPAPAPPVPAPHFLDRKPANKGPAAVDHVPAITDAGWVANGANGVVPPRSRPR
jgi:dolichyl-phosphate beta-glucosyltransferase